MRAPKGEGSLALEELDGFTTGLVALAGSRCSTRVSYGVGGLLDRLVGLFGRTQVSSSCSGISCGTRKQTTSALTQLAQGFRVPVVATNGVRFAEPSDRPLFDVLTCVYHHTTLNEAGRRLAQCRTLSEVAGHDGASVCGSPGCARRHVGAGRTARVHDGRSGLPVPTYPLPPGQTEMSFLRHITEAGARDRYRPITTRRARRLTRELELIEKLELAGYFLIVWDIVQFCREQDILVQGRGSAANSAVCYALGITAVDPVRMDLLFERFLSEERGEWPDIDLDLPSGDQREKVIQHVYERYGKLGAAMTANVITYRGRSRRARSGQGARLRRGRRSTRLAKVMNHCASSARSRIETARAQFRDGAVFDLDDAAHAHILRALAAASRICRAISASTPAAW